MKAEERALLFIKEREQGAKNLADFEEFAADFTRALVELIEAAEADARSTNAAHHGFVKDEPELKAIEKGTQKAVAGFLDRHSSFVRDDSIQRLIKDGVRGALRSFLAEHPDVLKDAIRQGVKDAADEG